MRFHLSSGTGVPNYRQIMEQVKYQVAAGALRPGDALPSIRALARQLAVNPSTIVKAYGELAHQGVVQMQQGKGAFIASGGSKPSQAALRKSLREVLRRSAVEAKQMGIPPEEALEIFRTELDKLEGVRQ